MSERVIQRVLVTGATGFIGSHLCEALVRQGINTRCLVRRTSNLRWLRDLDVQLCTGDVTDESRLRQATTGVDCVFHLAGVITARNRSKSWNTNCEGVRCVGEACRACPTPPALVLLSSVAAAGPATGTPREESQAPVPISHYGESKLGGERAAYALAEQLPVTVIRPGIVIGPRDRLTLPIFKTIATWSLNPCVGWGNTRLSLLHIADLVDLLLTAAARGERVCQETPATGTGIYFAADSMPPSYREFGQLIANSLERRVLTLPTVPTAAWIAAMLSQTCSQVWGRPSAYNLDKYREATQQSWAISSQKANQQLAWSPHAP